MTPSDVALNRTRTGAAAAIPASAAVRLPAQRDRSYHVTGSHVRERIRHDGLTRALRLGAVCALPYVD